MALKKILMLGGLVVSLLSSMAVQADDAWNSAKSTVDTTVQKMMNVLDDETLQKPENFGKLMGKIDTVVSPMVDFPYISERIMGRYARAASDEQLQKFSEVFKTTLLRTFAKAVTGFELKSYEFDEPRRVSPDPTKQVLNVVFQTSDSKTYQMRFFMLKQKGKWTLTNIMFEGVNLRYNFSSQFADLYSHYRDIDKVINAWADQVKIPDADDKAAADDEG